jgi:hypothetical protein
VRGVAPGRGANSARAGPRPGMDTAIPSKARPLVEQLVPVGARLHVVLAHLEACGAPDAPGALAGLLDAILTPLARRRPDDLALAARVLEEVAAAIEEELFTAAQ